MRYTLAVACRMRCVCTIALFGLEVGGEVEWHRGNGLGWAERRWAREMS